VHRRVFRLPEMDEQPVPIAIVVLGPPGAGKGTQSSMLANPCGFPISRLGANSKPYRSSLITSKRPACWKSMVSSLRKLSLKRLSLSEHAPHLHFGCQECLVNVGRQSVKWFDSKLIGESISKQRCSASIAGGASNDPRRGEMSYRRTDL
jgi:hypothetical protein